MIKSVVDMHLSPFGRKLYTYMYYGWLPHQCTYEDVLERKDLECSYRTVRRAVVELRKAGLVESKIMAHDSQRVLYWWLDDAAILKLSNNDIKKGFIPNNSKYQTKARQSRPVPENTGAGHPCPSRVSGQKRPIVAEISEPENSATLADAISVIPGVDIGLKETEVSGLPCTSILLRSRSSTSTTNSINYINNKLPKNARARVATHVPEPRSDRRKIYTPEEEAEFESALKLAQAYESKLKEYTKNPHLKYLKGVFSDQRRSYKSFLRAAKLAEELEMPPKQFIEAQFYYFHEWFTKEPAPHNLSGGKGEKNARWRAKNYRDDSGRDHEDRLDRVVSTGTVVKTTQKQRDSHSEKLLKDLLASGMTEEEVFREYAQPGMNNFSQRWLIKQPAWKRLYGGK